MIGKAVVAAAGRGTRMLPLTKNKPKPLLKIGRRPFLSYLLDNLWEAGYKELIVVGGYKIEKLEEFLNRYPRPVSLVNQFRVLGEEMYGTACALKCAEEQVKGADFLMVYADHIFSPRDLSSFKVEDQYNYIATYSCQNPQKYGALEIKKGFLKKIIEKPKGYPPGSLVNIGLYKFRPEIFNQLSKISLSQRGEYELTDAINLLAKDSKVRIKKIRDYWLDLGNPADIVRISSFLENEKNKINS